MIQKNTSLLVSRLRRLPVPANYYRGTQPLSIDLPKSVLCFCRNSIAELGSSQFYHYRYVLICNIQTAGTILLDGTLYRFLPGHCLMVMPYQFHRYINLKENALCWLFITFELIDNKTIVLLKDFPQKIPAAVYALIDQLIQQNSIAKSSSIDNRINLLAAAILNVLCAAATNRSNQLFTISNSAGTMGIIDKANQYIHSHIGDHFSITDIAAHIGISESRLRAVFKMQVGLSLGHCIQEIRLCKASGMLGNAVMNVSEVAFACGYESMFAFSRAFKTRFDISPRAYRQKQNLQ